jgi:hypothetical protein
MATEARDLRGPTPSVASVEIAATRSAATSSVTSGATVYGQGRREAGLRLYPEGVQTEHVAPQAITRPRRSVKAIEEALRKHGVPIDRLRQIGGELDLKRYGDPQEAARIDAEVMEDLAPLRAKANRAELPDWL